MKQDKANLSSTGTEEIPANPARLVGALRNIGYTLEHSITDLIDNSVNAGAKHVIVRFISENDGIAQVVIADDGLGMTEPELRNAMRFGSNESSTESLGKYGMGLKLASLGFAQSLTVVTNDGLKTNARKWTIEGLKKGWDCEVISSSVANKYYGERNYPFSIRKKGTLSIWEDIDNLEVSREGFDETFKKTRINLSKHLGVAFHRFLEDGRLKIFIDTQEVGEAYHDIYFEVKAINPFGYPLSGHEEFPKTFEANIGGVGPLTFEAHIWPANQSSDEYKLGGTAAKMQGFYFYRNDRLIQKGGWNGVGDAMDPHMSLARVAVDLPPKYDHQFGLNVQKSTTIVPASFSTDIQKATSADKDTFIRYKGKANKVYRKKDDRAYKYLPGIPADGVPNGLSNLARQLMCDEKGKTKPIDILWRHFETADVFWIDLDKSTIYLNKSYRDMILRDAKATKSDVPLIKTLIYFQTRKYFDKARLSAVAKRELNVLNELLIKAVKYERG